MPLFATHKGEKEKNWPGGDWTGGEKPLLYVSAGAVTLAEEKSVGCHKVDHDVVVLSSCETTETTPRVQNVLWNTWMTCIPHGGHSGRTQASPCPNHGPAWTCRQAHHVAADWLADFYPPRFAMLD